MAIDFDAAQITNLQLKRAALLTAQQLAAAHQIVRSNPRLMQGADPLVLATIALTIATNLGPMDLAIGNDPGFDPTQRLQAARSTRMHRPSCTNQEIRSRPGRIASATAQ